MGKAAHIGWRRKVRVDKVLISRHNPRLIFGEMLSTRKGRALSRGSGARGKRPTGGIARLGGCIMNTIGKILVILNFLFAILVGWLLVVHIALGNKWKEAHDHVVDQAKVLVISNKTNKAVIEKILADYKSGQREIEELKQTNYDADQKRKAKEAEYIVRVAELEVMLREKDLTNNETKGASQRFADEIALQTKTIQDRESTIVRMEADAKKLRTEAVQFEALARTRQSQLEALLVQVRELTVAATRERAGVGNPDVMVLRNPNEPNPPAVRVNGQVEKVDIDLIQISLGTDHGIARNNTLDVYRLQPEPKYLGMVRIVDANDHQSVARLIPTGNATFRTPLRVGDLVTSKLTR